MPSQINPDHLREQHGGNLSSIKERYPDAPKPLIDLSTCINPYAYPLPTMQSEWLHRLADSTETEVARRATARYYGAPHASHVTLASGMQPLLFGLASLRSQKHGAARVAILSPTYSEHGRVWQVAGHQVTCVETLEELEEAEVVILANPNNPTGHNVSPPILLLLAQRLQKKGGWLIVDESFADLVPNDSLSTNNQDNLIVLRSCGKFFGVAGLRASSVIATPDISEYLRVVTGPWPLSTFACHSLPLMFDDTSWINAMRMRLEEEAVAWRTLLAQYFSILGHTSLFTLVETNDAAKWQEYLASQGVLIRSFSYNPKWLRVSLPHSQYATRLQKTLAQGPRS